MKTEERSRIVEGDRQKMVTAAGEERQTEKVDAYKKIREEAAPILATLKETLEDATAVLALPGKYRRRLRTTKRDPTYEKRLKARQAEKKSTGEASGEQNADQSVDMSAPVSRKEAKKRRKATSPEKSFSSSARGQGTFLEEHHNGESASGQA